MSPKKKSNIISKELKPMKKESEKKVKNGSSATLMKIEKKDSSASLMKIEEKTPEVQKFDFF